MNKIEQRARHKAETRVSLLCDTVNSKLREYKWEIEKIQEEIVDTIESTELHNYSFPEEKKEFIYEKLDKIHALKEKIASIEEIYTVLDINKP